MIIRPIDKERLLNFFSAVDTPFEVWAFGSRVNGDAHETSDLDLVVRNKNGEVMPIDSMQKLKQQIQDSNIPILVELFDWARLPENFQKNISSKFEVFYTSK